MKLQDQVCTLEQAKRLKELGVEQTGYFMWQETGHPDPTMPQETIGRYGREAYDNIGIASAFTVAELGVMLPEYVGEWFLEMYKDASNTKAKEWYLVRYVERDGIGGKEIKEGFNMQTEAQARAAMLIYLLENKLTTAEECNKRLTP